MKRVEIIFQDMYVGQKAMDGGDSCRTLGRFLNQKTTEGMTEHFTDLHHFSVCTNVQY